MSMIARFGQINPAQLKALLDDPESVESVFQEASDDHQAPGDPPGKQVATIAGSTAPIIFGSRKHSCGSSPPLINCLKLFWTRKWMPWSPPPHYSFTMQLMRERDG